MDKSSVRLPAVSEGEVLREVTLAVGLICEVGDFARFKTAEQFMSAKHYSGKVRGEDRGFRGVRLMVNGRDRTKLLEGLGRQLAAVRVALAARGHSDALANGRALLRDWRSPASRLPSREDVTAEAEEVLAKLRAFE